MVPPVSFAAALIATSLSCLVSSDVAAAAEARADDSFLGSSESEANSMGE